MLGVCVKLRNYSQEQKMLLNFMTADLLRCNMVRANPSSTWACALLLGPKDGLARFQFTADLRWVNRITPKHSYLLPNVEQELETISGSTVFAKFLSFSKFPFNVDSQKRQSSFTLDRIYTPTRMLQVTTIGVTYLQSTISTIQTADLNAHI